MGLTRNNNLPGNPGRVYGASYGALSRGLMSAIQHAAVFGRKTSFPQGMNTQYAVLMTVQAGGNMMAKATVEASMDASVRGAGQLAASMNVESFWLANANIALNGYATFEVEADLVAALTAIGGMSANMDLLARPSAADIAQEVWNAARAGFQSPGSMGRVLSDAEKAAKLGAALSA
jgi:hypothetical protein